MTATMANVSDEKQTESLLSFKKTCENIPTMRYDCISSVFDSGGYLHDISKICVIILDNHSLVCDVHDWRKRLLTAFTARISSLPNCPSDV